MVMNKIAIYWPFGQIWPHLVGELSIIIPKKISTQIHNYIIQSQHDQWSIAVAVAIEQLLIQQ